MPTPDARPDPPPSHRPGVVVPHRPTRKRRLQARLIYTVIRILARTVRFRLQDDSGYFTGAADSGFIFSIWHNRLALSLILYEKYVQKRYPDRRMAAMVSASRDGAFMARILELFSVQPARGSTSRRGPQALRELTTWAERGFDLAITPDGPRGPPYIVQDGAVSLAQLTRLPIVPVSYRLAWKIRMPSWDRFQIPLPFTRCDVHLGQVFRIPPETDPTERERYRRDLETAMRSITVD